MATPTILPGQLRLIVAIAAVHIVAWYAYLSHIPLGLYPTAQEIEVIENAFSLAEGSANAGDSNTVYELLLSIPARFVSSASELVFVARFINALALILATTIIAHATGQYWKRNRPIWIAGLLTGLNPVLVFWSAEVSPTLLAVLLTSLGFAFLLRWLRHPSPQRSLIIGLLVCLVIALERSMLLFALIWPATAWLYPNRRRAYHLGAALVFPVMGLLFYTAFSLQFPGIEGNNAASIGRGIYEVFNNHEAYDGKSYGLHRQLNLFLFLNPIHWGLIFILAVAGAYIRVKNGHKGNSIAVLLVCLGTFALSYAIGDTGSQTRALLYPILAIFAGGISMMPHVWRHAGKLTQRKIILGLLLVAGLCYSDFYDARDPSNWEADYTYLAEANLALERNQSAAEWAEKTLALNPEREDMRSVILHAEFRDWALSPSPSPISRETAMLHLEAARQANYDAPNTRAIEALYLFKLRETEKAIELWKQVSERSALALICLYWTGNSDKPEPNQIQAYSGTPYFDLLKRTTDINRNALAYSEGEETLDNMLAFAH
ncbi:hypothetical protein DDZ13_11540 [Coraliomargarita sinensis]|uniref:Glycosyltransferase RgtA/B/C/D-like domain-containing protein n=1 Tax=Coraliomargarita sinensis TaxID=2174842 RepID=A0A317ZE80_9BACT|nr:hypothetical protein [Coraliomargarita sinensis]PXA03606.1 hypothetical protein DDZ13_11540 [Coraliomargarita sinensis]